MKKVADFIVEKYKLVMIIFVILTIIAAICSTKVTINTDLTKYLPDDSDMKVGMKIMEGEFGETTSDNTAIRVMFTGLSESEKEKMLDKLKDIKHVDSVAYDSESEDYNKDNYTKYDITVDGSYGSKEETAVEKALDTEFQNDKMTYVVDDTAANSIPKTVLLLALGILIIILLVMSESWFEPVLFIVTIMMAIILNLGTNLILGTVSNTTSSLGPILQLVLSMDYSIILMNRYHQELEVTDNRKDAMKTAWMHAFGSVSSSSLTTIVGLLALVFMSFKLGRDVGIVLAKGVFISVVSVLTFLPGITISATSLIQKTKKKAPVIPTDGLARFSYKFRKIITPAFIVLFIGVYFFQQKTPLTYSMNSEDEISKIFPKAQTVVLMYDNKDENGITALEEELESHDNVASVTGYGNMLGKKNSVGEMKEHIGNLSSVESEFIDSLDESLLGMLYYDYFSHGKVHPMLVSDFIKFLSNDVIEGETFGNQIDDSVKESINDLKKYANAEKLTKPMSIKELAKFMNLEEDSCKQLFLLYYIENGGVDTGKMTVQQFLQFIVNDVAKDETYGSSIDKEQLSTIQKMLKYTDYNNMTSGKTYKEMADLLEIDESTAQMLYVYYYANNSGYTPGKMTLPELVSYLKNDVANNKAFSSQFDSKTVSKLEMLSKFTDSSVFTSQMTASELAKLFGVDKSMVKNIMMSDTSNLSGKKMSIYEFMGYITKNVLTDKSYASSIDKNTKAQLESTYKLLTTVKEGKKFTAAQMASYIGMKEEQINQIYQLYFTVNPGNSSNQTLTLQEFTHFVMNNVMTNASYASMISGEAASKIQTLNKLINAVVEDTQYDINGIAAMSGMSKEMVTKIFALYFFDEDTTLSPQQFVKKVLRSDYASSLDKATVSTLKQLNTIMKNSASGTLYDYKKAADLFGMDKSTMKMLYTYKSSASSNMEISVQKLLNYIVNHKSTFSKSIGQSSFSAIQTLQKIVNSSISGEKYSSDGMAKVTGMDSSLTNKLYVLNTFKNGDISGWKLSVQKFVNFLNDNIEKNKEISGRLEADSKDKMKMAGKLINAIVSKKKYKPDELYKLISGYSKELDKNKVGLLYLYHDSLQYSKKDWKLNLLELVDYLVDDVSKDARFEMILDDEMKDKLVDLQSTLHDAADSLKGERYSRVLLKVKGLDNMKGISSFYSDLTGKLDSAAKEKYYLIGDSAMSYEMSKIFDSELMLITLLTAVAIFVIVALTFRNLVLPAILVLIVQCGVYITVSVVGIQGLSLYYLALLMVECILMGSTIDYGILFTTYYLESRKTVDIKEALKIAYRGSIHTIMTSGSILVIVTGVLSSYFPDPSVSEICRNISIGALSAATLILFILPGILATMDKFIVKKSADEVNVE